MKVRVVVACHAADGVPDLFGTTIECSQEQYEEGDHYDTAKEQAEEARYEGPMVAIDENDYGFKFIDFHNLTA